MDSSLLPTSNTGGCGRRGFLGMLLALGAGAGGLSAAGGSRPASGPVLLNKVYVAGFQYYGGVSMLDSRTLSPGRQIDLVAEPENPHDVFAVRVEAGGRKIGYIPRTENHHLSRLLNAGVSLRASILDIRAAGPPGRQVRVAVTMES